MRPNKETIQDVAHSLELQATTIDPSSLVKIEESKKSPSKLSIDRANLSYSFAMTGSVLMAFKTFLSIFIKKDVLNNPSKTSVLKTAADFCHRLRDTCQYSIYAQPGSKAQRPDDTAMDFVNNLDSALLGRTVYNINAFYAPWVGIFKAFFPYSHGLLGLPTRLAQTFDDLNSSITYLFWNIRKMVWSLVPYDGRVKSQDLLEKQNQVKDIATFLLNRAKSGFKDLWRVLMKSNNGYNTYSYMHYQSENKHISNLISNLTKTYINKWKTLFSAEYKTDTELGEVIKTVGQEESDNHWLFVRSKIFSQLISLPIGFLSGALNTVGIFANVVGNIFDDEFSKKIYTSCSDFAHALLSLSYLTGEVPANLNEFYKKFKFEEQVVPNQLICAGIGAVGMLNKVKILPGISQLLTAMKLKPILDAGSKIFDNLFYGFFSYNRLLLHQNQKENLKVVSSNREVEGIKKFDHWWKFANLPIRVLMRDEDVCFFDKQKDKNFK